MAYPTAHRAHLPAGYGLPPDSPRLDWAEVDARLRDAPHYWIGTVGTDGVPTVRPIDGMWLDGALFFGSDPASRWRRNLAVNPRAAVHLEDAELGGVGAARVRAPAAAGRPGRAGRRRARLRHRVRVRLAGPPRRPPGRHRQLGAAAGHRPGLPAGVRARL